MIEAISRRQLLLTGGALFIPGCREYVNSQAKEETLPDSPTVQPHSTPESSPSSTILAVTHTPTPNLEGTKVALLELQVTQQAQLISALQTREARPTNTPIPPTPTLRPILTSVPPTAIRIPPTATRAIPMSTLTPNEANLLDQSAKVSALGTWMNQFLREWGKPPIQARPNEDTFYINGYRLDLEGQKLIGSGDEKQLRPYVEALNRFLPRFRDGQAPADKNHFTAYWATQSAMHYTGMGKVFKSVEGIAELKDIRLNISQKDPLSRADMANDIRWRGKVKLDYLLRVRANYAVSYSLPVVPVPDHNYSGWSGEDKTIGIEIGKKNGEDYIKDDFVVPSIGYHIPLNIMIQFGRQGVMFIKECDQQVCRYPQ